MSARIGYVLGGNTTPKAAAAIAAGQGPRPEYLVMLQRNDATPITYQDVDAGRAPLARLFRRWNQRVWALAAVALAASADYDALITTGEDIGVRLALLARARRARIPIHIITHGSYFGSDKFGRVTALLNGAKNIHYFCLAESLRRALIERFAVPPAQAHATGYATDTRFFRPAEPLRQPLIVSGGTANRDYRTLLQATAGLDVPVRIAADSAWYPEQLDIAGSAVPAHVQVGSYDYPGLRDLYAAASFVVVPLYPARRASGLSVIAEAMAMGKAVIASHTEADSDFIVEGETGYYVEPGDVAGLRVRIAHLLAHPDQAQQMGQRARRRMEECFSVEAYCERMERVIQTTVGPRPGRG